MSGWSAEELDQIGATDEIHLQSELTDGNLSKPVTIWAVRAGSDVYVRSVRGRSGAWWQRTQELHRGQIRAGKLQKPVEFAAAGPDAQAAVDSAYHEKYGHYATGILGTVLTNDARQTTLKLLPR